MYCLCDIILFEREVSRIVEEAFPDKKYMGYFYDWGWEYPYLEVGFVSTQYDTFCNYKLNGNGSLGYMGSSIGPWKMSEYLPGTDQYVSYYKGSPIGNIFRDVIKKTKLNLEFYCYN